MKRLFPAPWLSLALWVLWLALNLSMSPGCWARHWDSVRR